MLEDFLTSEQLQADHPSSHPDDCDCDDCGYEHHKAHVTLRIFTRTEWRLIINEAHLHRVAPPVV